MRQNQKAIIFDANILVRAVLGTKVAHLLTLYRNIGFFSPDVCFEDAKKYIPSILQKRSDPTRRAIEMLDRLPDLITCIPIEQYQTHREEAKHRIRSRDLADWPVIAAALTLNSPIWTEDQDFFGVGIATWTTDRVHLFFQDESRNNL